MPMLLVVGGLLAGFISPANVAMAAPCDDVTVTAAGGGPALAAAVQTTEDCPGPQTITVEPGSYILDHGFRLGDQLTIAGTDPANRPSITLRVPANGTRYLFYVDPSAGSFTARNLDVAATAPWALAYLDGVTAELASVAFSAIGPPLDCSVDVSPAGVYANNNSNVTVTGVSLTDPSCYGATVGAGSHLHLDGVSISGAPGLGVSVQHQLTVENSFIHGNGRHGIGGLATVTVANSLIYGNGDDGIHMTGGSLSVATSGIGLYGAGGELIADGNGGDGISALFTDLTVDDVVIANNQIGVLAQSNGRNPTSITGSTIFGNADAGIDIGNYSGLSMSGTELRTNSPNCRLGLGVAIDDGGGNSDDDGTCGTNHAPTPSSDRVAIQEDTTLVLDAPGVLANDADPDGDALTAELVSGPAHASAFALEADGSVSYTPEPDWVGDDRITYRATDGTEGAETVLDIRVLPVNDPPVIDAPPTATVDRDTATTIAFSVSDVDANDDTIFDDPDAVTPAVAVTADHGTFSTAPISGATVAPVAGGIAVAGELVAVNKALLTLTYTPAPGYLGPDVLAIEASDRGENGAGGTLTADAEVAITVVETNRAPIANDESYEIDEDEQLQVAAPGVLNNDIEPDGDEMAAELVTGPAVGDLDLEPDGSFTYQPPAEFSGEISFVYRVWDGLAFSNDAQVTITINEIDDDPTVELTPATLTFAEDGQGVVTVTLADPDDPVAGIVVGAELLDAELGTVAVTGAGATRTITVTGALDRFGSATLQVGWNDGSIGALLFVPVVIEPVNDPPTIAPITDVVMDEDSTTMFTIAVADVETTDPAALVVTAFGSPAGIVSIESRDGNTKLFIDALPDASGDTTATVTVSDGVASTSVEFGVEVRPVNDPPTGVDDAYETNENTELKIATEVEGVLGNDMDVDGDVLSAIDFTQPDHGVVVGLADGTFSYEPELDFFGADEFTYVATDGTLASAPVTVTVDVLRDNTPPVIRNFVMADRLERATPLTIVADAVDAEGDQLTYTWSDNVSLTATPWLVEFDVSDDGEHEINLEVCDPFGGCASASDTLIIVNVSPSVTLSIIDPDEPFVGETAITAQVEITDPGPLDTHTGSVDWGDGTTETFAIDTSTPVELQHTFEAVEVTTTRSVTVEVTDDDGGVGSTGQAVVLEPPPNEAPTARVIVPSGLRSGYASTFRADQSTDDRGIVEYRWQITGAAEVMTTTPVAEIELPTQQSSMVTRQLTLTVVDEGGLTDSVTAPLAITHGGPIFTVEELTLAEGEVGRPQVSFVQRPFGTTQARFRFPSFQPPCALGGDIEWVIDPEAAFRVLPLTDTLPEIRACTDAAAEDDESITFTVSQASGPFWPTVAGQVIVTDSAPFFGLVLDTPTVEVLEGDVATISWTVLQSPSQPLTLELASDIDDLLYLGCTSERDYLPIAPSNRPPVTRVITTSTTAIAAELATCEDAIVEETETVPVRLEFNGFTVSEASVKIVDDDAGAKDVTVGDARLRLVEGETGSLIFSIEQPPAEAISVWLSVTGGDAVGRPSCQAGAGGADATDFVGHLVSNQLPVVQLLSPDVKEVAFDITACDLGGVEPAELVTLELMMSGAVLAEGEIVINDRFSDLQLEAPSLTLVRGESGAIVFTSADGSWPAEFGELSVTATTAAGGGSPIGASCVGRIVTNELPVVLGQSVVVAVEACPFAPLDGPVVLDVDLHVFSATSVVTYDIGSTQLAVLPNAGCTAGDLGIPESECLALLEFFYALDGPNWVNSSGWTETDSPCDWLGVICSGGHVVELSGTEGAALVANGLSGELPEALLDLPELRVLRLWGNTIGGGVPAFLSQLASLEVLDLSANQLDGPVPASIGEFSSLQDLRLSHNSLSGPLPAELAKLVSLDVLRLDHNLFEGPVPEGLAAVDLVNLALRGQAGCLTASAALRAWIEPLDPVWNDGCPPEPPTVTVNGISQHAEGTESGGTRPAVIPSSRFDFEGMDENWVVWAEVDRSQSSANIGRLACAVGDVANDVRGTRTADATVRTSGNWTGELRFTICTDGIDEELYETVAFTLYGKPESASADADPTYELTNFTELIVDDDDPPVVEVGGVARFDEGTGPGELREVSVGESLFDVSGLTQEWEFWALADRDASSATIGSGECVRDGVPADVVERQTTFVDVAVDGSWSGGLGVQICADGLDEAGGEVIEFTLWGRPAGFAGRSPLVNNSALATFNVVIVDDDDPPSVEVEPQRARSEGTDPGGLTEFKISENRFVFEGLSQEWYVWAVPDAEASTATISRRDCSNDEVVFDVLGDETTATVLNQNGSFDDALVFDVCADGIVESEFETVVFTLWVRPRGFSKRSVLANSTSVATFNVGIADDDAPPTATVEPLRARVEGTNPDQETKFAVGLSRFNFDELTRGWTIWAVADPEQSSATIGRNRCTRDGVPVDVKDDETTLAILRADGSFSADLFFDVCADALDDADYESVAFTLFARPEEFGRRSPMATSSEIVTFTVGIKDDDEPPPMFTPHGDITVVVEAGAPDPSATWLIGATDFAGAFVPVDCKPGSASTFGRGTTTVRCTATDDAGATATTTFDVIVTEDDEGGSLGGRSRMPRGASGRASASGFGPGSTVVVELRSDPKQLATLTADADGRVAIRYTVPVSTALGEHHLVFVGEAANGQPREVRLPLTVLPASAPPSLPGTGARSHMLAMLATGLLGVGALAVGWARTRRPRWQKLRGNLRSVV